jgi:hypothetical protein
MEASFTSQSLKTTWPWAGLTIRCPGWPPAARLPAGTLSHDHSRFLSLALIDPNVPDLLSLNEHHSIASKDRRAEANGWLLEMKISEHQS